MAPQRYPRNVEILLVEDSPTDVMITCEALQEARLINNIHIVEDGVQATDFLHKYGDFADVPRPDLILLDLNLPRKSGIEVLAEIKAEPELRSIPVIVLTTSSAEEDIVRSYNLHANSYVVKPVGFDDFIQAVHSIEHFWFNIVTLPLEP